MTPSWPGAEEANDHGRPDSRTFGLKNRNSPLLLAPIPAEAAVLSLQDQRYLRLMPAPFLLSVTASRHINSHIEGTGRFAFIERKSWDQKDSRGVKPETNVIVIEIRLN